MVPMSHTTTTSHHRKLQFAVSPISRQWSDSWRRRVHHFLHNVQELCIILWRGRSWHKTSWMTCWMPSWRQRNITGNSCLKDWSTKVQGSVTLFTDWIWKQWRVTAASQWRLSEDSEGDEHGWESLCDWPIQFPRPTFMLPVIYRNIP